MSEIGRRALLSGAATAAGGAAATAGAAAAQDGDVVDRRGESEVEIAVGPDGRLVYDPARVRVDPGTTLRFVWDSPNHNVVVSDAPEDAEWVGSPNAPRERYDTDFEFSETLDVEGTYEYYCSPHRGAGMEGTILVGDDAGVPEGGGGGGALVLASFGALLLALLGGIAVFYVRLAGGQGQSEAESDGG
jgi:plastocyanin